MKKSTIAIQSPFPHRDAYGAIAMPVYHTDAYEFDNASVMADAFCGRINEPDYSRITNPTVIHLENRVKALTGARDVVAVNSGMAAISNVILTLASAGRNIVTSRHLFGNTFALLSKTMTRFGVECRAVDLLDEEQVEKAVDDNTCALFFEIITNPQLEVADVAMLARIAHKHNTPLVADTTAIPFTQFDAHALGVDIEVVSSTKYISGGATTIGGLIIDYGTIKDFDERLRRDTLMNFGAYMTPHVAYMQTLGLENLEARYALQSANTVRLANLLRTLPQIKEVNFVGFTDNPFHTRMVSQFGGSAGAMMTIDLESEQACYDFLNALKLVKRATNLFDNKTLAIHPASTIFGPFTPDQRKAMDVKETTIRLSVGLEDVDDIFEDIKQALQ
ncbi:MAG: aminotransferase class V-fold PLP-dependent enzyme [Muribaculaceae bacterium]|nr:aminotransferase class V-fold PLP-dependent enzyme [Muribaculaceae bacterium]